MQEENPNLVDGKYSISDLVDLDQLRHIFEMFSKASGGFTIGFLDHPEMNILIAVEWRDICTKFHRSCPQAADICLKSNQHLLNKLTTPGELIVEACENGLVDCATPIIIKGKHIASLATGQLLLEEPDIEYFKKQAKIYGFDEKEYLEALKEIPVIPEQKVKDITAFLAGIAMMISEMGYANLEIKAMQEELKKSQRNMKAILDTIPDMTWLKDMESKYIIVNEPFAKAVGLNPDEMVGKSDYDFWPKELAEHYISDDKTVIETRQKKQLEEPLVNVEGQQILIDTIKMPVLNESSEVVGTVGISRDITERKREEKEKAKLENQLQQAQKMESVGRLAGGVAHDFNNMLGVILGYGQMAMEQISSEHPLHANLDIICKAAERSVDLTRQLLAFARRQTVTPKLLDINEVVVGMLKMLQRLIGEDVNLAWLPGANLWSVKVDPSQIDQILANLCVNARDAISGVGRITIETKNKVIDEDYCETHTGLLPGEYVYLAVSDDGCGMDKEMLEHIFEPFFTTKEIGEGTGLGLSTVYGAVKQNNGFINVYSEQKQGTTFMIYLPRYKGEGNNLSIEENESHIENGKETILLVEDEPFFLKLTLNMLCQLGYHVLSASTPFEAIRLVKEHPGEIDLLITDVVMPEMNGRDLAECMLAIHPNIKRLFMSGYTANVIAHRGILDEGVNFIQKPFSKKELAAKVRESLV
ncbi:MAG: PocR ligand-binding domain-containing protein [bacterium]